VAGNVSERRQRQVALQMEEGRRTNQVYIDAAVAEAARLMAARAVPEQVARQEEPRQRVGINEGTEAQPPTVEVKREGLLPSDHNVPEDVPPSGSVADPEAAEVPPAISGYDIAGTISPPSPPHIDHSS
jgi:hypothetical protein